MTKNRKNLSYSDFLSKNLRKLRTFLQKADTPHRQEIFRGKFICMERKLVETLRRSKYHSKILHHQPQHMYECIKDCHLIMTLVIKFNEIFKRNNRAFNSLTPSHAQTALSYQHQHQNVYHVSKNTIGGRKMTRMCIHKYQVMGNEKKSGKGECDSCDTHTHIIMR